MNSNRPQDHPRSENSEREKSSRGADESLSDWNIVLLFIATMIPLALACQDWFFDVLGDIDAFKYVGLFLNYGKHLTEAEADYKISRLPWILPGVFVYKLFAPRIANYVLQVTFTFASTLFLYLSVRTLFNRRVALIASLIYATNPWYQGPSMWASGGWNYHNTACLVYYFASFFFFLQGAREQNRSFLLLAGASMACCAFTTVFMAPFLLALLLTGWFCFSKPPGARTFLQLYRVAAGFLAMTFLLSVASVVTGGRMLFFLKEWVYTFGVAKKNIYFMPVRQYLDSAYWLVYPALAVCAIGSLWLLYPLWKRRFNPENKKIVLLLHLQFLFIMAYLILLSTTLHQSVLQFPQMTMLLAAPMMPAIAAFLFVAERHRKLPDGLLLSSLMAIIMVGAPWAISLADKGMIQARLLATLAPIAGAPALVPFLLTAFIVYQFLLAQLPYAVIGTALCFAVVSSLSFPYQTPLSRDATCCVNRDAFEAVVDANQFLTQLNPSPDANRIIYSFDEHLGYLGCRDIFLSQVFNSVGASRFCPKIYDWINLSHWDRKEFLSLRQIAILSSFKNEEPFTQAFIAEAKTRGVPFVMATRQAFTRGQISFAISILASADERPN